MNFFKRRICGAILGTTIALTPVAAIVSCGDKTKGSIVEPSEEEKHKQLEVGVLSAEYKFELSKAYSKDDFSVTITDSKTNSNDSDIDFTIEKVEEKTLICKAQWKKEHILTSTCSFDLKFENTKDQWSQEIKGFSITYTSDKVVESINIVEGSCKTTYDYGDKLDTSGLLIEVKAEGVEQTETIGYGFTTEPTNGTELSHVNNELTVTCGGKSATTSLTVNRVLITANFSTETSFKVGETVKKDDISAKGYYSDQTVEDIKDECVFPEIDDEAGAKLPELGPNTFHVYWKEDPKVSASFAIMASEGDLQQLQITRVDPTKEYATKDKIYKKDFTVEAIYPSGYSEEVKNYTVTPAIPDAGYALQEGNNEFTFSYTDASGNTKERTCTINAVTPIFTSLSVTCRRRYWYKYWPVYYTDFTVIANYSNFKSRTLDYDSSGEYGYTTNPIPSGTSGKWFGSAHDVPNVTFKYKYGGVEKSVVHKIIWGEPELETLSIYLKRNQYDAGEQITANDIDVYAKFIGVEYAEKLDYDEFWSYHTDPALPYKYTDADAQEGKKSIFLKTDEFGKHTSEDIGQRIKVTNELVELNAYPRSSKPYYVGNTIEQKSDIVVDARFKSGRVVKDYTEWETDETFPITLTEQDVPDKVINIHKNGVTCECHVPVVFKPEEPITLTIDPTSIGKYDGKETATFQATVGDTWAQVHTASIDDTKISIIDDKQGKRKFGYWSLSNSYEEIKSDYTFHGGEIITARYADDLEDENLLALTADANSKVTITNYSPEDNIWYSKNRKMQGVPEVWQKVENAEVIEIPAGYTYYFRGENKGHLEEGLNFKIEGEVYIQGNATALLNAGGLDNITEPDATTTFAHLFENSPGLYYVPADFFPYTIIRDHMYESTFANCTNLFTGPNLTPAKLTVGCYSHMYEGCTNLMCCPGGLQSLIYTNYPVDCMNSMFKNCPSLTNPWKFDFKDTTVFDARCFESMFENDFGCPAILSEWKECKQYTWFNIPSTTIADINVIAHNMFCFNGIVATPKTSTEYCALQRDDQTDFTYNLFPMGGRYFRQKNESRENEEHYRDPRISWRDFSDKDNDKEWSNKNNYNMLNLLRGTNVSHEAISKNDNYREVVQKIGFKIIVPAGVSLKAKKVRIDFRSRLWATSNYSIMWSETHNCIGMEIYQSSDRNWWPDKIGDAYASTWRDKYHLDSFTTERFECALRDSQASKEFLYNFPLNYVNNTEHPKVLSIYFIFASSVDGNDQHIEDGNKRGSVNYYINIKQEA